MGMYNDMRPCSACGQTRNVESMDCSYGVWTCAGCVGPRDPVADTMVEDVMALTDEEIADEIESEGSDLDQFDQELRELILDALAEAEDRRIMAMTPDEVLAEAKGAGEDTAEFAARMRDFVDRAYEEIVENGGRS